MEDAGHQLHLHNSLMTKLSGNCFTPGHGTTLINRSGHYYQLHRPHLPVAVEHQQDYEALEPPVKQRKTEQHHSDTTAPTNLEAALAAAATNNKHRQQQQHINGQTDSLVLAADLLLLHRHQRHDNHLDVPQHHPLMVASRYHHQRTRHCVRQPPPVSKQSTHISCLYPEILAMIFSNLDIRDKGRAAQVCTTWREAAYHKSAWRGVEARLHLKKHATAVFHSLEKRGIKRVQILSLSLRRKETGLYDVFRGIKNLQSLNLSGCYNITDASLSQALNRSYPSLTELNLSLCKNINDQSLIRIATHLKNLEILHLGGCGNISNTGLQFIAWGLKKLRRLDLRSCWHISDLGISYLAGQNQEFEGNLALEHLGLQDCQRLSDEGLRHLSMGLANSLKSINLSFCVLITDSGMKHIAKISSLCDLDLRSCDNISEIGIAYLAEGGSKISSLDVSFCDKIGDQALQHISQGLFNLKSLSLSACPISDEGISKIAKTQQELETLHIGQCSRLTDASVVNIVDNLPLLKCIDLYGCTKITKDSLDKIDKLRISLNLGLWQERR